ncbi:MAG: hypothetical protein K2N38_00835 [Oscillospiraceae bacterium]|nr:hypothetical protein [Oscillospiraceae bacterium]
MKKRFILCAVSAAVTLSMSGCVIPYNSGSVKHQKYEDIVTDTAAIPFDPGSEIVFIDADDHYNEFGNDELQKRFIPLYNEIVSGEFFEPSADGSKVCSFIAADRDGVQHEVTLMRNAYETYLTIDGRNYPENAEMSKLAREIVANGDPERIPKRMFNCLYECDEPVTKEEFIKAAQGCVFMWLDTLKSESGAYKITGYSPDKYTDGKFIAAGTVGGATEFAVEVIFDVKGIERGSVFKSDSYSKFYHYYDGACVFVRCRWENGVCRIVEYDDAFTSAEELKSGLNGINKSESGYKTFFDFFNDTEKYSEYKASYPNSENTEFLVVSHNPFMLSDGNIFYADISKDPREPYGTSSGDGLITAKFRRAFYDVNGVRGYSSPVDYDDATRSAVTFSYSRGFDLVFDDYNRDGSPDYTIRLDIGDDGSYYEKVCIDNNGKPSSNGEIVYMPGRFEESVRLQMTENGVVNRDRDDAHELDSFRMYSQRYYLPPQLRGYKFGDKSVICSFWNNTEQPVTAGGSYRVERLDGDKWTNTGVSGSVPEQTVEPYYYVDIEFDISQLSGNSSGEYRIVLERNKVSGGFYIDDSAPADCTVTPEYDTLPSGRKELTFDLTVKGTSSVRPTSARLFKDGTELMEVDVSELGSIDPHGTVPLTAAIDGDTFGEGTYTLKISCGAYEFTSSEIKLVDMPNDRRFFFSGSAQTRQQNLSVTVTNNSPTCEDAKITYLYVEVERNGVWVRTSYVYNGDINDPRQPLTVKFGEQLELDFEDLHYDRFWGKPGNTEFRIAYNKVIRSLDKLLSDGSISKADYVRFKEMSYDEFLRSYPLNTVTMPGDRCRVVLTGSFGTEYVYYNET